jgi:SAM-dependent methyltransferase
LTRRGAWQDRGMAHQLDPATEAQRRAWALGDYPAIARDILAPLAPELVEACGVQPGQRVLDVATGTGNVAFAAAAAGAEVVGLDLVPELLAEARRLADERGAEVEWVEGDAQELPFGDADFDAVMSCLGVMFAPDHEAAARELLRVCRPGGTIGLVAWLPAGPAADLMRVVAGHAPPAPPGAASPLLWGDKGHILELLGDRARAVQTRRGVLRAGRFAGVDEVFAYYRERFGPGIAVRASFGGDLEREAALDEDLRDWAARASRETADGGIEVAFDYVLTVARRRE